MKYPQSKYVWDGIEITNTWIKTDNFDKYSPITQVYVIVFNAKGEILVCRELGSDGWILPGGHPENGESFEETLRRELLEEVDIEVSKILPLGVQKASGTNGITVYQARCIATLKSLLPQTPDPANGKTWERAFVPPEKITEYIKCGETGNAMFMDAMSLHS